MNTTHFSSSRKPRERELMASAESGIAQVSFLAALAFIQHPAAAAAALYNQSNSRTLFHRESQSH
jgi:hypothetical protein